MNLRIRRTVWAWLLGGVIAAGTLPVQASSTPFIAGVVSGIELCPQYICGSAIFVGTFSGRVGRNPWAFGTIAVSVNHEDLPAPGDCAAITGGVWKMWIGFRQYGGETTGTLYNNGDNTYTVRVDMSLEDGGFGTLYFTGILDHNVFPPTIRGYISQ